MAKGKDTPDPTPPAAPAPKPATRRAVVKVAGRPDVTVEFPADAPDPKGAAVAAYTADQGIWHLPAQPEVILEG